MRLRPPPHRATVTPRHSRYHPSVLTYNGVEVARSGDMPRVSEQLSPNLMSSCVAAICHKDSVSGCYEESAYTRVVKRISSTRGKGFYDKIAPLGPRSVSSVTRNTAGPSQGIREVSLSQQRSTNASGRAVGGGSYILMGRA